MEDIARLIVIGMGIGCIYGIIGLTLSVVLSSTKVINIAQGEFATLGVLGYFFAVNVLHLAPWLSLLITLIVVASVGFVFNKLVIVDFLNSGASTLTTIIVTLTASFIMSGTMGILTGYKWLQIKPVFGYIPWKLGFIRIPPQYGFIIATTGVLALLYWVVLKKTNFGMAMRAVGFDRVSAELVGVDSSRVTALSVVLSFGVAAIGGVLIAPLTVASASMGLPLLIKGFIAAVLGGINHPFGALVGGVIIGEMTTFASCYLVPGSGDLITFILLLPILIIRPTGIFER